VCGVQGHRGAGGEENADASDAHAMRVVLSLGGLKEGLRGHIVVELSDVDSDQLVKVGATVWVRKG